MHYALLDTRKEAIQVDSKALGQKPLERANRCIIDGKVLKVTKKENSQQNLPTSYSVFA